MSTFLIGWLGFSCFWTCVDWYLAKLGEYPGKEWNAIRAFLTWPFWTISIGGFPEPIQAKWQKLAEWKFVEVLEKQEPTKKQEESLVERQGG